MRLSGPLLRHGQFPVECLLLTRGPQTDYCWENHNCTAEREERWSSEASTVQDHFASRHHLVLGVPVERPILSLQPRGGVGGIPGEAGIPGLPPIAGSTGPTGLVYCHQPSLSATADIMLTLLLTAGLFLSAVVSGRPVKSEDLCESGGSYCEEAAGYPLDQIIAALRKQAGLVNTPGLFDPVDEKSLSLVGEAESDIEQGLPMVADNELDSGFELYDNGIVPY